MAFKAVMIIDLVEAEWKICIHQSVTVVILHFAFSMQYSLVMIREFG